MVGFPGKREAGLRKVFKLRTVDLPLGARVTLKKSISLRDRTTRRAVAGTPTLATQVDGVAVPLGAVEVT